MKSLRPETPRLIVEGKNDQFTIFGLLERHGLPMAATPRPVELIVSKDPKTDAEGIIPLLSSMEVRIKSATQHPVGFVVDTDIAAPDRWAEVAVRLQRAGLSPPQACPQDGYIDQVEAYPFPVGVWMMPDCQRDHGTLEHFLQSLIAAEDPVWPLASHTTEKAKSQGAGFRDVDLMKAKIHCWLAWQSTPGQPYGMAITSKFFRADSPEAIAFLRWVKTLFQLDSLNLP